MPGSRRTSPAECVFQALASMKSRKEGTCVRLGEQVEATNRWLEQAIEECMRKIREGESGNTNSDILKLDHPKSDLFGVSKEKGKHAPKEMAKSGSGVSGEEYASKSARTSVQVDPALELKVKSMKVTELREELQSRGMETTGIKKVLRDRLWQDLIEEAKRGAEQKNGLPGRKKHPSGDAAIPMEIDVENCTEKENLSANPSEKRLNGMKRVDEKTDSNTQEGMKIDVAVTDATCTSKLSPQTTLSKTASVTSVLQTETGKSPTRSFVKAAMNAFTKSPARQPEPHVVPHSSSVKNHVAQLEPPEIFKQKVINEQDFSSENPGSKTESRGGPIYGKPGQIDVPQTATKNMESISAGSSNARATAITSATKAQKDARRAKLEEIRGKSKPVGNIKTPVEATAAAAVTTILTKSAAANNGKDGKDGKRKLLAAQMRQKALRNQTQANTAKGEEQPAKKLKITSNKVPHKSPGDPAQTKTLHNAILSPMDTYEISDRENSDDSDSDDSRKPKKKIPKWAQKANLAVALESQYSEDGRKDPDHIFGEVMTCDLEAIFDKKKSRYAKRTSSGNWTQDHVTVAEKLTYKRAMGYSCDC